MTPWVRALTIVAAVLAGGIVADQFRGQAQRHFIATQTYEDVYYLPPPNQLVTAALGYRAALADLVWMKALIYFGEELHHRGGVEHLYAYTDAMLALDPYFKKVYRWVASTAIYRTGKVTDADVRKAIRYLQRGIRLFPDDGELAWDLGATYSFELAPLLADPTQRAAAKRSGLEYLELAALRGAGPAWLVLQTAGQLRQLGRAEQAIKHLEDVYATVTDENVKQQVLAKIGQLRSATYAQAMEQATREFEATRAKTLPYIDAGLFMLIGPRPAFDGTQLLLRHFDPQPELVAGARQAAAED
ncbi:MAG TPA: hypothetical protein VF331_23560 [Polyangiales bacterium]